MTIYLDAMAVMAMAAKTLSDKATPGPWKWWTSCSFRRLTEDRWDAQAGGVMHAFTCRDGVADIEVSDDDMAFIAASRTAVPTLADAVLSLVERVRELEGWNNQ